MNRVLIAATACALASTGCVVVVDDGRTSAADADHPSTVYRVGGRGADESTVNRSIRIDAGALAGRLESVNGSIRLGADARVASIETVNGMVRTGPRPRVSGDIETVNGSIALGDGSQVDGSVRSINGRISLDGARIAGRVESYNADLDTGRGSHIARGIHYRQPSHGPGDANGGTPRITIGPGSVVEGPLRFDRPVRLYVHDSARIGTLHGAEAMRYSGDTPPG